MLQLLVDFVGHMYYLVAWHYFMTANTFSVGTFYPLKERNSCQRVRTMWVMEEGMKAKLMGETKY